MNVICWFFSLLPAQVLATVKNQIEEVAATRKDFPEMITAAQHWLLARDTLFTAAGDYTTTENFSHFYLCQQSSLLSDIKQSKQVVLMFKNILTVSFS